MLVLLVLAGFTRATVVSCGHLVGSVTLAGLSQTWVWLTDLGLGRLVSRPPATQASSIFLQQFLGNERESENAHGLFQTKSHSHAQGLSEKVTTELQGKGCQRGY